MPGTTISNLTNGTQYIIRLSAVNAVGMGAPATVESMPFSEYLHILLNKGFTTHTADKTTSQIGQSTN
jgi:hypothetical protein